MACCGPFAIPISTLTTIPFNEAQFRLFSFPGSAWERTAPEALPRFEMQTKTSILDDSAGRACKAVGSKAEPWNQSFRSLEVRLFAATPGYLL